MKRLPHARFGLWSPIRKFISDRNHGSLSRHKRKRSLHIETLEERAMMAVDTSWNSATGVLTLTTTDGTPVIVGSILPNGESTALVSVNSSMQLRQSSGNGFTVAANLVKQIIVTGSDADDVIVLSGISGSTFTQLASSSLPFITYTDGRNGNDTIVGTFGKDSILGGLGNDIISSLSGNDTVSGGLGNDSVSLGDGDDQYLGTLNDSILGADGNDTIQGGTGNDTVQNDGGDDAINLGDGDDQSKPIDKASPADGAEGEGNDTIDGGNGNDDNIDGGEGNDSLIGGVGDDTLDGGEGSDLNPGSDIYFGGTGNDRIKGTSGAEIIVGGDGDDFIQSDGSEGSLLVGGNGSDQILGGTGRDILIDGPTNYDTDLSATGLKLIRQEWERWAAKPNTSDSSVYAEAIQHLLGQVSGGLNQSYTITIGPTSNDNSADILKGGSGIDWFVGGFSDTSIQARDNGQPAMQIGEWIDDNSGGAIPVLDVIYVPVTSSTIVVPVSTLLANDGTGNGTGLHLVGLTTVTSGAQVYVSATDTNGFATEITVNWGTVPTANDVQFRYSLQSSAGTTTASALVTVHQMVAVASVYAGDFNGDGLSDAVEFNPTIGHGNASVTLNKGTSSDSWGAVPTDIAWRTPIVGDFTGDGKDDILARNGQTGDWYIWRSTGTAFIRDYWSTWNVYGTLSQPVVGDYDGDGRDDLFLFNFSTADLIVATSTGDSFDVRKWSTLYSVLQPYLLSGQLLPTDVTFKVGDFDGDGRDDVLVRQIHGLWSFVLSEGYKFTNPTAPQIFSSWTTTYLGDFDGDGADELLVWESFPTGGGSPVWQLVEFETDRLVVTANWGNLLAGATGLIVKDVNFDGRDDLVRRNGNSTWDVLLAGPSGFSQGNSIVWSPILDNASWLSPAGRLLDQINPITLSLANDDLDSPTDLITDDSTVRGVVTVPFGTENLWVEIDLNQDGIVESFDRFKLPASGQFTYRPDSYAYGQEHTLRARIIHHDPASGVETRSDWAAITYLLNRAPEITSMPDSVLTILPRPAEPYIYVTLGNQETATIPLLTDRVAAGSAIISMTSDSTLNAYLYRKAYTRDFIVALDNALRQKGFTNNSYHMDFVHALYTEVNGVPTGTVIFRSPLPIPLPIADNNYSRTTTLTSFLSEYDPLSFFGNGLIYGYSQRPELPYSSYELSGTANTNTAVLAMSFQQDFVSPQYPEFYPTTLMYPDSFTNQTAADDYFFAYLGSYFVYGDDPPFGENGAIGQSSNGYLYYLNQQGYIDSIFLPASESNVPSPSSNIEKVDHYIVDPLAPLFASNTSGAGIWSLYDGLLHLYDPQQSWGDSQEAREFTANLFAHSVVNSAFDTLVRRLRSNTTLVGTSPIIDDVHTYAPKGNGFYEVDVTGDGVNHFIPFTYENNGTVVDSVNLVVNGAYSYNINSEDRDNDEMTYSVSIVNAPSNVDVNDSHLVSLENGKLIFRPTELGDYKFKLTVADGHGASAKQVWTVHVDTAPQEDKLWLVEGDRLVTTNESSELALPRTIDVQKTQAGQVLKVSLNNIYFDLDDTGSVRDSLELAIYDDQGQPVGQSIGLGQDAFFNLSHGVPYKAANGVGVITNNDGQLEIYLPLDRLTLNAHYHLEARIVNNDGVWDSQVSATDPLIDDDSHVQVTVQVLSQLPSGITLLSGQISAALPSYPSLGRLNFNQLADVTSDFYLDYGSTSYAKSENTLLVDLSLTAKTSLPSLDATARILLAIRGISSPGVRLANATGYLPDGTPYIEITNTAFSTSRQSIEREDLLSGIQLRFTDPAGAQFTYSLSVLTTPNAIPVFDTPIGDETIFVGAGGVAPYQRQVHAVDPEGGGVSYSLSSAPKGMTINPTSGLISWQTPTTTPGRYSVVVAATDDKGASALPFSYVLSIEPSVNHPPIFTQLPEPIANYGTPYESIVKAKDIDGDLLSLGLVSSGGLSVILTDHGDGTATISFAPTISQVGRVFTLTLSITDNPGDPSKTVFQDVQIAVHTTPSNHPPVILNEPPKDFSNPTPPADTMDDVSLKKIDITLDAGESATVHNITLNTNGAKYARIVMMSDSTQPFSGYTYKYKLLADLATKIDNQLVALGIGSDPANPNLFSLVTLPLDTIGNAFVRNFASGQDYLLLDASNPLQSLVEGNDQTFFVNSSQFSGVVGQLVEMGYHGTGQLEYAAMRQVLTKFRSSGLLTTESINGIILVDDQRPLGDNLENRLAAMQELQGDPNTTFDDVSFTAIQDIGIEGYASISNSTDRIPLYSSVGGWTLSSGLLSVSSSTTASPSIVMFDLPSLSSFSGSNYSISVRGRLIDDDVESNNNVFIVYDYKSDMNYKLVGYKEINGQGKGVSGQCVNGTITWNIYQFDWDPYLTQPFEFSLSGNNQNSLSILMDGDTFNTGSGFSVWDGKIGIATFGGSVSIDFMRATASNGTNVLYEANIDFKKGDFETLSGSRSSALWIDDQGTPYISSTSGNYAPGYSGQVKQIVFNEGGPLAWTNKKSDYADLAFASRGSLWAVDQLVNKVPGTIISSTTSVFAQEYAKARLAESFVHLVSDAGVVSNITRVSGTSNSFDVTFVGDGQPRNSFELRFIKKGGEEVASIPVVIRTAGYHYDIEVFEPDDDALTYELIDKPSGAVLTGTHLSWPVNGSTTPGIYHFSIKVTDSKGASAVKEWDVLVASSVNNASPKLSEENVPSATVSRTFVYQFSASDIDQDSVRYYLRPVGDSEIPSGMTIDRDTGKLVWIPQSQDIGFREVEVVVIDGRGGQDTRVISIPVQKYVSPNISPTVTLLGSAIAIAESLYVAEVKTNDPNGDPVTVSLAKGPDGMFFDASQGIIYWQVPKELIGKSVPVVLRVEDGRGGFDIFSHDISVTTDNTPPYIGPTLAGDRKGNADPPEGGYFVGRVVTTDLENDPIELSIDPEAEAAGLRLDSFGNVWFVGSLSVVLDQVFKISADDGYGGIVVRPFQLKVIPIEYTLLSSPKLTVNTDGSIPIRIYDPALAISEVTLDQTSLDRGMTLSHDGSTWQVHWKPYLAGTYNVMLMASGPNEFKSAYSFAIHVVPVAAPINHPPTFDPDVNPRVPGIVGKSYSYSPLVMDEDGDDIVFSLNQEMIDVGMMIDPATGKLTWTPSRAGLYNVEILAKDEHDLITRQSFDLPVVNPPLPPIVPNSAPTIRYSPRIKGYANVEYVYDPSIYDADGDSFSVTVDPGDTPASGQQGLHWDSAQKVLVWDSPRAGTFEVSFTITDSRGLKTIIPYTLMIDANPPEAIPKIVSSPLNYAVVGREYSYTIAVEPTTPATSFALASGAPSWIHLVGNVLYGTPTYVSHDPIFVDVTAYNSIGIGMYQRFGITVLAQDAAPVTTSTTVTIPQLIGEEFAYYASLLFRDPDAENGDFLTYRIEPVAGGSPLPTGLSIDAQGKMTWNDDLPSTEQEVSFKVVAMDRVGLTAFCTLTIDFQSDITPPKVNAWTYTSAKYSGDEVAIGIAVSDPSGILSIRIYRSIDDGTEELLDLTPSANGYVFVTLPDVPQASTVRYWVRATDNKNNTSPIPSQKITLDVSPRPATPPTVKIYTPYTDKPVNEPTKVFGTVSDDGGIVNYSVSLVSLNGINPATIVLGSYSGPSIVNNTLKLGTSSYTDLVIDPRTLANGSYRLVITATDTSDAQYKTSDERIFNVDNDGIYGNLSLSFSDLTVSTNVLPIQIVRTYDIHNATQFGEFGYGWSLSLLQQVLQVDRSTLGNDYFGTFAAFRQGTRLTFTLPDGTKQSFRFAPQPVDDESNQINFDPESGTTAYLTVSNPDVLLRQGIVPGDFDGVMEDETRPYNPADPFFAAGDQPSYILVNNEITYKIDAGSGRLVSITTPGGDSLTISETSIKCSDGTEVRIEWGTLANGVKRITQVIDPQGNAVKYGYDVAGDLISVTNRAGEKVTYAYGGVNTPTHGLRTITDPSGVVALQATYSTANGTITVTSAGSGVTYDYSGSLDAGINRVELTKDGNGRVTQEILRDPAGNIIRKVQVKDPGNLTGREYIVTLLEYDEQGRVHRQSLPIGLKQNQLPNSSTDVYAPLRYAIPSQSIVWAQTTDYDQDGHVIRITDATGHAIKYTDFDQFGHSKFAIDLTTGAVSITDYNDQGNLTYSEDALGNAIRYTYDTTGKLLQKTEKRLLGNNWVTLSENTYDSRNRVSSTTDSRNQKTFYLYDDADRPVVQFSLNEDESTHQQMLVANTTKYDVEGRATESKHYVVTAVGLTAATALSRVTFEDGDLKIDGVTKDSQYSTSTHYDNGRVDYTIDQYGNKTHTLYDQQGRVVQTYYLTRDQNNQLQWMVTRTAYNNMGQVQLQADPFILAYNTTKPLDGALENMPLVSGSPMLWGTSTGYDEMGRVITSKRQENIHIQLVSGPTGSNYYNVSGSIDMGTTISTMTTQYRLDGLVDRTWTTYDGNETNGAVTQYNYDAYGRQAGTTIDPGGRNLTTQTFYDTAGRVARSINASGAWTWFEYNVLGQQVATVTERVTDPDAINSSRTTVYLRTETEYDEFGRRWKVHTGITMTDPNDRLTIDRTRVRTTEYKYATDGKLTQVTLPEVPTFHLDTYQTNLEAPIYSYEYDERGNQTALVDPLGRRTEFAYDAEGRQITRTLPVGVESSDPNDFVEKTTYDLLGNIKQKVDLDGRVTEYVYDYDLNSPGTLGLSGRLMEQCYWESEATRAANTTSPTEKEVFTYDAMGQILRVQKYVNGAPAPIQTIQNAYDLQGHLTQTITTENGQDNTINYAYYKGSGRVVSISTGTPNGQIRFSNTFDGKGVTDTAYAYDALGRLTDVYGVERNDVGHPLEPVNITVSNRIFFPIDDTQYSYDRNGNLDWEILPDGVTVDYTYDSLDRLTSVTSFIDGNNNHHLDWNDSNSNGSWTSGEGERPISTETYTVDIFGQRTNAVDTFYNLDGSILRKESFDWEYDDAGKLVDEVYSKDVGDTHSYHDHFYYDLVGNRVAYAHDDKTTLQDDDSGDFYFYDDNDRLSGDLAFEIENGDIQPIKTTTYEYGTLNSSSVLTHDGTSLARKTEWEGVYVEGSSNTKLSSTEYRYNLQGRMSEVKIDSDANGIANSTVTYTYDANGNRISQTEVNSDTTKTTITTYIVDIMNPTGYSQVIEQKQVVDDVDMASDISARTSFTIGLDVIAQQSATRPNSTSGNGGWTLGTLYTLLYDGHGSTRALLTGSGSSVMIAMDQQFTYSAYGELLTRYNSGGTVIIVLPETVYLYSGEQTNLQTGMQNLRNRDLMLATGRFTTMDSFAGSKSDPQGLHKYLYANDNPISGVDPSGYLVITALAQYTGYISGIAAAADSLLDPSSRYEDVFTNYVVGYGFGYLLGETFGDAILNRNPWAVGLVAGTSVLAGIGAAQSFGSGLTAQGIYRTTGLLAGLGYLLNGQVGQFSNFTKSFIRNIGSDVNDTLVGLGLRVPASIPVPAGHTRVYRAVSEAEFQDILQVGHFRKGSNSFEFGKWFADSPEGAKLHGDALMGVGKYRIIEADVPSNAPSLYQPDNMDGRGPARYLSLEDLINVFPRLWTG